MVRVDLCVTVDYIIRVRVRILEIKINIPLKFHHRTVTSEARTSLNYVT